MQGNGWRTQFGADEKIQRVRPIESHDYIPNPHKGTTTYQRFNGEAPEPIDGGWNDAGPLPRPPWSGTNKNVGYPDTTVVYLRWLWRKFEPVRGERNWTLFDEYLKTAEQRGQTVQFRFNTYDAGQFGDDWWYWRTGGKRTENGEPDINDPNWYECFSDLIQDFGRRYDGHPLLDTVDITYGGMWGENGGNATPETIARFIECYQDAFKQTHLMVMEGDDALAEAARRRLGWRADCYGDMRMGGAAGVVPDRLVWNHMLDRYPFMLAKSGCQDCWKYGPVTLETAWTVGWWLKHEWDLDFILDQGLKYHLTYFMPKSCAFPEAWMDKLITFNKRMGYRFVPRQFYMPIEIRGGQDFRVQAWIDNVGCAPIYKDYRFALRLRQGRNRSVLPFQVDVRKWLPEFNFVDETLPVPAWAQPGEVQVDIGLIDAAERARVRFAIQEVDADGWHPVTRMLVIG